LSSSLKIISAGLWQIQGNHSVSFREPPWSIFINGCRSEDEKYHHGKITEMHGMVGEKMIIDG